jgi:hypothetical protein
VADYRVAFLQLRQFAFQPLALGGDFVGNLVVVKPNEAQDHMGCYPADGELSALLQKKCFEAGLILETG